MRILTCLLAALALTAAPPRTFKVECGQFLLEGRPLLIRSGEMHYPRVPRAYWRDRMRKMRAMGLNTLCTYVFWNLHEPAPGRFDFSGDLDLAAYLRTAQEEGLNVILRPGPYVCAEWEFGGFPAWLLKEPGLKVRSTDPRFLEAARRYLRRVGQEVADLQCSKGGPIILVQVENEYGSFGADAAYKQAIRKAVEDAGFTVPRYTSDGPDAESLAAGSFLDLLPVVNFGAGPKPAGAFEALARFRPGGPRMCGEYWTGWFDHYGEAHHTTDPGQGAQGIAWMLGQGISFNLYMFHGGTTFGFMNGANLGDGYAPDTTSYDYDVMLDEAGRPTAKFQAYREVPAKYCPNCRRRCRWWRCRRSAAPRARRWRSCCRRRCTATPPGPWRNWTRAMATCSTGTPWPPRRGPCCRWTMFATTPWWGRAAGSSASWIGACARPAWMWTSRPGNRWRSWWRTAAGSISTRPCWASARACWARSSWTAPR